MLKDIIDILKNVSLRHKGVYTFRYQGEKLNNAQNNFKGYQVYIDDINLHELNITTNIFKVSLEIYVLGQPNGESGNTVLDVQNNAYTIAVDIMAKIDTDEAFRGILSVYDYSILTLSHYTSDNAAGVKLSLVLAMPSPVNLCELEDNFNDEPYEPEKDADIDIDVDETGDIDIKPITLRPNRRC